MINAQLCKNIDFLVVDLLSVQVMRVFSTLRDIKYSRGLTVVKSVFRMITQMTCHKIRYYLILFVSE